MNKQILINVGGMLAVGAMVFGSGMMLLGGGSDHEAAPAEAHGEEHAEEHGKADEHGKAKSDDHGKAKPDEHGKAKAEEHGKEKTEEHGAKEHGKEAAEEHGAHGKSAKKADDSAEMSAEELKRLQLSFDDLMSRGRADDARMVAMKANSGGQKNLDWQIRLADATYASDALPIQQRLSKAYEQYTTIIGQNNDESKLEWARYRVCITLKQLGRWQDGVEATEVYLAKHGKGERAAEVRLMYAQGLLALGRSEDAQEQIAAILDGKAPEGVRAMAMVERAQLQVIESKTPSPSPKATSIQIEEPSAETVELGETAPAEFIPVAVDQSSPPAGVPAEQWASIRRAAEVGDIKTAQKLVGPYLESKTLSENQRAGLSIRYASLLKDLSHSQPQGKRN